MEITQLTGADATSAAPIERVPPAARPRTLTLSGELVAAIAHDLRQPLTAIEMNVAAAMRLLRLPAPALDDAADAMADVLAQERRMRDAILVLEELAAHRAPQYAPCDFVAIVREAVALVRSDAAARHIVLELDAPSPVSAISGDATFVRHAVLDVLIAALDVAASRPASVPTIQMRLQNIGTMAELAITFPGWLSADESDAELALATSVLASHGGTLTITPTDDGYTIVDTYWPLHAG